MALPVKLLELQYGEGCAEMEEGHIQKIQNFMKAIGCGEGADPGPVLVMLLAQVMSLENVVEYLKENSPRRYNYQERQYDTSESGNYPVLKAMALVLDGTPSERRLGFPASEYY